MDNFVDKAVPIVLRTVLGQIEILVFEHPLAGVQLVKGTVEAGERPASAAVRELAEESGLTGVAETTSLGSQRYRDIGQVWHFYLCRFECELSERWEFLTADDNGHLFKFYWHPLTAKIDNPLGPVFELARRFIEEKVESGQYLK